MNKHTPGPWALETVPTSVGICHKIGPFPPRRPDDITPRSACLYADYPSSHNPADDELMANARLICAAPDLLEALSEIINDGGKFVMTHETHRKAHAAIAKAIGEA